MAAAGIRVTFDPKAFPPGRPPRAVNPRAARQRLRAMARALPVVLALRSGPRTLAEVSSILGRSAASVACSARLLLLAGLTERSGQFAEPGYTLTPSGRAIVEALNVGLPKGRPPDDALARSGGDGVGIPARGICAPQAKG